jgi:hypothetical protein
VKLLREQADIQILIHTIAQKKLMASNSTIIQVDINEKSFYEKVDEYINSLGEKSVIKQDVYNDIQKCPQTLTLKINLCFTQ